jgi:protein subunit release factor A
MKKVSIHGIVSTNRKASAATSSITVVILDEKHYEDVNLSSNEIKLETTRGTGNGGQHKNSTDSCVVVTSHPTGQVVRDGRNQHKKKKKP